MGSFITPDNNNAAESLKFYMSLVNTDDFGDYKWSKEYKGLGTAMLWDIQQTKEGNTLLIGSVALKISQIIVGWALQILKLPF